ncbi:hypothetical protein HanHA300_Chr15g0575481 [Helianthus annuus]|nr:hypothetical protein HanHA300_Chr15g0575481 [Helianthus annuus]KAJ0474037.1 hypothetical protein HanHA89_Chr15g0625201 [Helianthus annuus]KAJ0649600.1 hypothetical protein HanLR1_Chr15g0586181 [Helianthus annuus]KAJ0653397.1 hypothetical protein HanOQP8_Chr15g0583121 [Helianthus annuus]
MAPTQQNYHPNRHRHHHYKNQHHAVLAIRLTNQSHPILIPINNHHPMEPTQHHILYQPYVPFDSAIFVFLF